MPFLAAYNVLIWAMTLLDVPPPHMDRKPGLLWWVNGIIRIVILAVLLFVTLDMAIKNWRLVDDTLLPEEYKRDFFLLIGLFILTILVWGHYQLNQARRERKRDPGLFKPTVWRMISMALHLLIGWIIYNNGATWGITFEFVGAMSFFWLMAIMFVWVLLIDVYLQFMAH